jgi:hypothetical protein
MMPHVNDNTTMGDEGGVWAVMPNPSKDMLFFIILIL